MDMDMEATISPDHNTTTANEEAATEEKMESRLPWNDSNKIDEEEAGAYRKSFDKTSRKPKGSSFDKREKALRERKVPKARFSAWRD
jgi:hypothetical protein